MKEEKGYKFVGIRTTQFAYFDENLDTNNTELKVSTSYSYGVNEKDGSFLCAMTCRYDQGEKPVMKIDTEAQFLLNNACMKEYIKGKEFELPREVVCNFTSMLYGATRGILSCKLEGTRLVGFVLPPTNLADVITSPLIIKID